MSTLISYKLVDCKAFPTLNGLNDVLGQVTWQIVFEDGVSESIAIIETQLPVDDIDPNTFVPLAQLTKSDILTKAKAAQDVDALLIQIQPSHEANLVRLTAAAAMVPIDVENIAV